MLCLCNVELRNVSFSLYEVLAVSPLITIRLPITRLNVLIIVAVLQAVVVPEYYLHRALFCLENQKTSKILGDLGAFLLHVVL